MRYGLLLVAVSAAFAVLTAGGATASPGATTLISVSSTGDVANDASMEPVVSADGRYVAFWSWASNLVPGDTNDYCPSEYDDKLNCPDVFVRDIETGQTTRVSVSSDGQEGNDWSVSPTISVDGRYVAFRSNASNLVPGDTNTCDDEPEPGKCDDVFVHDSKTGETTRVSVDSEGNQGNGPSGTPFLSADGRYVAFTSAASNLVPGDTNGVNDAFVHDLKTGETTRVSVNSTGEEGNSYSASFNMSSDGRYVAFWSLASNLVVGDSNDYCTTKYDESLNCPDIFVHDRETGETTRVSVNSAGIEARGPSMQASLSADGRFIAFLACPSNEVNKNASLFCRTFVHDRQTHETELITSDLVLADMGGYVPSALGRPTVSSDGRYVALQSPPADEGPAQIAIYDRQHDTTEIVSVNSAGKEPRLPSWYSSISADGRYVAFGNWGCNLTPEGEASDASCVFLRKRAVASEGMAALHVAAFAVCGAAVLAALSILGGAYVRRRRQAR